jgi:DNA-binding SARP family transcriptional activator
VAAYLLGSFRISIDNHEVEKWFGSRGCAVLKYLLVHRSKDISREVLMDIFWPEASPKAARNNLNVALHNLRQSFYGITQAPIIEYEKGSYRLNPSVDVWTDVEEFDQHIEAGHRLEALGQLSAALGEFEVASSLYQGDFLVDDVYEEWPVLTRERLRVAYLDTLDRMSQIYFNQGQYVACISLCQQILARDRCREDAHGYLMRCYSRQGQDHLALRQYQSCVDALRDELDVAPDPATSQIAERIRRHERV